MRINVTQPGQQLKRKTRTPNFPIGGRIAPYGLYPIWAHPVLPGETLQSASQKTILRSEAIKNPLMGAWHEQWLVYFKFSDLDRELGEMFIKDTIATTGFTASSDNTATFTHDGQIDWIGMCLRKLHESYFLHEGETAREIHTGIPQVKLNNASWYQNMMFEPADQSVPTSDASDLYEHLQGWMMLQQMQMTDLTYEDYLETYGVKASRGHDGEPEILRFGRSWTTPVNSIEPTTGAPSSAWLWNLDFKSEKPKRFQEPGFVVAFQTVRPKMRNANTLFSAVGNLWGFSDWFPSYNLEDPTAGVKEIAKNDPVFEAAMTDAGTETLIYDHRDLLSHGESFYNATDPIWDYNESTGHSVKTGANAEDVRGEYCTLADIKNIAAAETPDTNGRIIAYDGIAMLRVSGHIEDTTR